MTQSRLFVAALCVLAAGASPAMQPPQRPAPAPTPLPSFGEPALSPDRREIAFASGGDIWTVSSQGGEARLLVSHEANESRPLYSPDGQRLAFVSDRTGGGDIYVLTLATGTLQQITFDDGLDRLDAWSRDGQWLYFSSTARDVASMNDIQRVRATGGTPASVSAERYTSEFFAAPAADGRRLAFTARGVSAAQWWRRGRSHLDESELWLLHDDPAGPRYEQLTERGAKQMWPMWGDDGRALYFVSDRGGTQNLWLLPLGGTAREITHFNSGRVLWPSISYDGREIVFERDFEIWKLDTASGRAAQVDIVKRGAPAAPALAHVSLAGRFQELVLSPDGKKVAFLARGDVWAAGARDGGDAVRVTRTYAEEGQVTWTPDSRCLIYMSERDGTNHLFTYDFTKGEETQLTNAATRDAAPVVAPDGKTLAFIRDEKELRVLDLASKQERTLAKGHLTTGSRSLAWSPDSKWIAYVGVSASSFLNLFAVPAAGGDARPLTSMPNGNSNNLSWSPDGTYIIFNTSQRTEQGEAVRVDLLLRTPQFREDRFRDLFRNDTPRRPAERPADQAPPQSAPAPQPTPTPPPASASPETPAPRDPAKPVEIVFEGIRRRVSILPVGVDVISQAISPDAKSLLLTATAEGQQNLYIYSLDELAREPAVSRQLTSTPGPKVSAQFSPDSKDVFYLEQGRITSINLETRQPRPVAVTAETDVDFSAEKNEIFRQAWTYMRDGFYDDKFHGVDWEAVRTAYAPRIAGAQTPDEMRRLLNLMVGELNASHMGVAAGPRPPGAAEPPSSARLGLRFDRVELEQNGRFKVSEVIALGPAAVTRGIAVGDYLTRIDGTPLGRNTSVDEIMIHAVNRRVALEVSKAADGSGAREVAVRPITMAAEKSLLYQQWVEANRAYVDKVSGGRLGYAHMLDMSETSLRRLYMDLDADNRVRDGIVIDLRNNNGGFVNAYALDVLARRGYMNMTPRGFPTAPARTMLGQRALELPTILVTNQHSLSDAEDFTEGYRALKLGKVVGEPTAGWIIYTGSATLVDGSTMRMPRVRITTNEGKTMELNPRPVDVAVTRPIGESLSGKDSQLDRAAQELLAQLGSSRRTSEPR